AGSVGSRLTVIGAVKEVGAAPRVAVIVFGSRAEGAGELLAIDVNLFVTLAPPGTDGIRNLKVPAHKRSFSTNVQELHISERSALAAIGLPLRMERVGVAIWRGRVGENFVAHRNLDGANVFDLEPNLLLVRHRQAAGHGAIGGDGKRQRFVDVDAGR